MSMIMRALRSPGAMRETIGEAPTQHVDGKELDTKLAIENAPVYQPKTKPAILDRGLDRIVRFSGSIPAFVFIQVLLVAWAFLGIPFNQADIWPIIISDAQAIFSYMFDSLLMRQQLNGYYEGLDIAAELKSRNETKTRLLQDVERRVGDGLAQVAAMMADREIPAVPPPKENWFNKFITISSTVLGHILFIVFYWACIFVWLGVGPLNDWSNQWQLDLNSATSALMVLVFSFLAILRERHADYLRDWLGAIYRLDSVIEARLRRITDDESPNPQAVIPAARVNSLQRAINYYADIVGTLVGIAILLVVLVVWLALGPVFQFSPNWWLFIGTYAGLIGLNDGFVLRNVQAKLREHEQPQYNAIHAQDAAMFTRLGLAVPALEEPSQTKTISYRVSERMNKFCGHEVTVLAGVLLILGLLTGSSVMMWSETGQLLSNVPPSVIESFFMIILITGHNAADRQRRTDMTNLCERRRQLLAFIESAEEFLQKGGSANMEKRVVVETKQVGVLTGKAQGCVESADVSVSDMVEMSYNGTRVTEGKSGEVLSIQYDTPCAQSDCGSSTDYRMMAEGKGAEGPRE